MGDPDQVTRVKVLDELRGLLRPVWGYELDQENAAEHDTAGLKVIAASLEEHGFHAPLIADAKKVIRIGNGRFLAARDILKWTHVPIIEVKENAVAMLRRSLVDNRSGDYRTWDEVKLAAAFSKLTPKGKSHDLGWSAEQLEKMAKAVVKVAEHTRSNGGAREESPPDELRDHSICEKCGQPVPAAQK